MLSSAKLWVLFLWTPSAHLGEVEEKINGEGNSLIPWDSTTNFYLITIAKQLNCRWQNRGWFKFIKIKKAISRVIWKCERFTSKCALRIISKLCTPLILKSLVVKGNFLKVEQHDLSWLGRVFSTNYT